MEDAVTTYISEGHKELEQIVKRIKKMYKELGGDVDMNSSSNTSVKSKSSTKQSSVVAEIEEEESTFGGGALNASGPCLIVTVDQFVGFVEAMAEKMSYCFDGYYDAFSEQYGKLTPTSSV